jgi:hypothetical protein
MKLINKQKLEPSNAARLFNEVWGTKKKRDTRIVNHKWVIIPQVFIDGSLTFVILTTPEGDFFGFSKFNPEDKNYSEISGIFKALSRAIDHLLENI